MKCEFKVCHGSIHEREMAYKNIVSNMSRGCIVDAITLHIVKVMDLYDVVSAVCGPLHTTESIKDIFRRRYDEILVHNDRPFMTMYWQDGNYFREEMTVEKLKSIRKFRESELKWVENEIKTIPSETKHSIPGEAEKIRDAISSQFLDPILAVQSSDYVLLCEDLSYRQFATQYFDIKASWFQPVLLIALDRKLIAIDKYIDVLCCIIDAGHVFITIDSGLLQSARKLGIKKLESIAKALFCIDAEVTSHQKVLLAFLNELWGDRFVSDLDLQAATSILLRRLFFGKWRISSGADTTDKVLSILGPIINNRNFVNYLHSWMAGHFIID